MSFPVCREEIWQPLIETGSAEGALVPVLLRITHWPKSGLPVSPPGLFPPWCTRAKARAYHSTKNFEIFETGTNGTEVPENPEIVEFPESEPFNRKFRKFRN